MAAKYKYVLLEMVHKYTNTIQSTHKKNVFNFHAVNLFIPGWFHALIKLNINMKQVDIWN